MAGLQKDSGAHFYGFNTRWSCSNGEISSLIGGVLGGALAKSDYCPVP